MAHGPPPGAGDSGPVVEEKYNTRRVVGMATVAALGGFPFGFDSAVVNGTVDALKAKFDIGDAIGFVVAIALLGSAVGAWFAGPWPTSSDVAGSWSCRHPVPDRRGRPSVPVGGCRPHVLALHRRCWDRYRVGDRAHVHRRDRPGTIARPPRIVAATGHRSGHLHHGRDQLPDPAGGQFRQAHETNANNTWLFGLEAWQWMFLVMIVPALVYGLLWLTIPESPRYLVSVGRTREAAEVLSQVLDGDQHAKVAEIEASLSGDHKPRFSDLKGAALGLRPIVWVGIALSVFQQFVGINVIFYYSNSIWASVGFEEDQAFPADVDHQHHQRGGHSGGNLAGRPIGPQTAAPDRICRDGGLVGSNGVPLWDGRDLHTGARRCWSSKGCVDADAIGTPYLTGAAGPLAVVAANLYVVFFGVSWVRWSGYCWGDVPQPDPAAALAVGAAAQWIANFLVSVSFPGMASIGLGFAYGVFTVMAVLSFFFVAKFIRNQGHEPGGHAGCLTSRTAGLRRCRS